MINNAVPIGKELQNSWVVVTGGSRGIGKAISLELAARGANVAIIYLIHHAAAEQTLAELKSTGVEAEKYPVDVGNYDAIQETFAAIFKAHARVDVLVNCAGINLDKTLGNLSSYTLCSPGDKGNLTFKFFHPKPPLQTENLTRIQPQACHQSF